MIVGGATVRSDPNVEKTCLIEPQLPYLYLPQYDMKSLAGEVANTFKGVQCHSSYCKWDYSCDRVDLNNKKIII